MLLKDCHVGSVVRLVRINGLKVQGSVEFPNWQGSFHVHSDSEGNFVIDNWGNSRRDTVEDHRYEFEIIVPAPSPRITFTVSGKEFYVGQRVWGTRNSHECVKEGQEAEICGHRNFNLAVRVLSDPYVYEVPEDSLQFTPPVPHEWKRGDWARHEKRGVVWVSEPPTHVGKILVSGEGGWWGHVPKSELTFISHSEPPE